RKLRVEGLIDGYGEFGRPHYKALPESVVVNELVTIKVLEIMKDLGGVIHLHLEQAGEVTVQSVASLCGCADLPESLRGNVVLHHSTVGMGEAAERLGFSYTLTGRFELLREAFSKGLKGFIPESDFVDDPSRPGVVMYPWEISAEVKKLLDAGVGEDLIYKVMVDNVVTLYGVEPP
ncbi:MAG: TatD family hydrolase, partial [Desulfurococcales archaeon]|nr:TatD family hydrolase [Desulfurococcales archaeon]